MIKNLQGTNYFLMLALGATLIGFAPIFVKWSELSPAAITFWRMLLALPLLICFNYAINKKIFFRVKNKKTIFYTALASLAFTTDLTLWHYSMNITSVANATIIVNSAPIFVALLAFIFYKELPAKGFGKSFLITYVGIIGLIIFSNNYANGKIFGDLLCMIAAIFYAVYLLIISKLNKETSLNIIFYTSLASLAFTTDLTLWHYSMNITSVANATIIVNSAPIFVALLAFIFYKELPAKGFGKSFLITYVGIIGLIIFSNNYANGKIFGDLLCMIAAIFYAVYLLIISKLNKETSLNIIFYTTFFCCLFSLMPIMINSKSFIPISNFEWINMLLMAFLCQFGGQFLITFGIGKISASTGSIGLLMQPLTATLLAALIFTEILNLIQIVFVFITLVGIYLARLSTVK